LRFSISCNQRIIDFPSEVVPRGKPGEYPHTTQFVGTLSP
jgi:hypothetical protein